MDTTPSPRRGSSSLRGYRRLVEFLCESHTGFDKFRIQLAFIYDTDENIKVAGG